VFVIPSDSEEQRFGQPPAAGEGGHAEEGEGERAVHAVQPEEPSRAFSPERRGQGQTGGAQEGAAATGGIQITTTLLKHGSRQQPAQERGGGHHPEVGQGTLEQGGLVLTKKPVYSTRLPRLLRAG